MGHEKRSILILLNGRSTMGILADVSAEMREGREILVVVAPNDQLPPALPGACSVEETVRILHEAPESADVILVANGGTTAQLVPVLVALATTFEGSYTVVNVQRDGVTVLATRSIP